jgi:hypothetical protein
VEEASTLRKKKKQEERRQGRKSVLLPVPPPVPKCAPNTTFFQARDRSSSSSSSSRKEHTPLDRLDLRYSTGCDALDGGMNALKDQFLIWSGLWKHSNRWEAVLRHAREKGERVDSESGRSSDVSKNSKKYPVSFTLMKKLALMGDLEQYEKEVAFNIHQPFLVWDRHKLYKLPYPLFRQALLMVGLGTFLTSEEWLAVCMHFDVANDQTVPYGLFANVLTKQVFRTQWKRLFRSTNEEAANGDVGDDGDKRNETTTTTTTMVITGHKKLDDSLSVLRKDWQSVVRKLSRARNSKQSGMNKFARSVSKKWKALQSVNQHRHTHSKMVLLQAALTIAG